MNTQLARDGDGDWWRGAVVYQIYPRSFMDADGDGLGDLAGIAERLDHVADLGVDAIWIAPFFTSPMRDFGYDVSDMCAVDPRFGTLADFDRVVARAHALGLKVLIDQILCHTSDAHPWFLESRASRENEKADWYVWADARPDGGPPNNWLSLFGGIAWTWSPERRQYYLHKFLPEQPALDLFHPQVQAAVCDVSRFWLDRGVDGFRLDSVNFFHHDPQLHDNPPRPEAELRALLARPKGDDGIPRANPYNMQIHENDKTRPETVDFLRAYRAAIGDRPGVATMAEIAADGSHALLELYTAGEDRLHMGYTFELLSAPFETPTLRALLEDAAKTVRGGWPCWAFSNHDVVRAQSRWGAQGRDPAFARMLVALLTSLRGSSCLYQGEELGLPEAEVAFADLQDPYGRRFWPSYKGRDGSRTPMPWEARAPHAGFTAGTPWLPVPDAHRALAVDAQRADPASALAGVRRFLLWRKRNDVLRRGEMRFIEAPEGVLAFERRLGAAAMVCAFDLTGEGGVLPGRFVATEGHGFDSDVGESRVLLPRWGAFFGAAA
ncbi:alpha-amylase family glycosyl hydrolase [Salinarimonas sp. NSM]|uniref:alpha-amylase family glycosyl hydrolase n=1 Tax=Salinarimonas sp. NSM TaxID=3458003 RepID=UPI00403609A4